MGASEVVGQRTRVATQEFSSLGAQGTLVAMLRAVAAGACCKDITSFVHIIMAVKRLSRGKPHMYALWTYFFFSQWRIGLLLGNVNKLPL